MRLKNSQNQRTRGNEQKLNTVQRKGTCNYSNWEITALGKSLSSAHVGCKTRPLSNHLALCKMRFRDQFLLNKVYIFLYYMYFITYAIHYTIFHQKPLELSLPSVTLQFCILYCPLPFHLFFINTCSNACWDIEALFSHSSHSTWLLSLRGALIKEGWGVTVTGLWNISSRLFSFQSETGCRVISSE
jgi:hypothetical protein